MDIVFVVLFKILKDASHKNCAVLLKNISDSLIISRSSINVFINRLNRFSFK